MLEEIIYQYSPKNKNDSFIYLFEKEIEQEHARAEVQTEGDRKYRDQLNTLKKNFKRSQILKKSYHSQMIIIAIIYF